MIWAQQPGPAKDADSLQEVVVTGSRVIANGNDSPTPVTVLDVENALTLRPTTIADALNDLPTFSGSRGQVNNPGSTSGASAQLNLRNMGSLRTLSLFDGHRLAPSSIDGNIDTNMVPQMLLQRVDVVTGGVSAVYGSDGVTGVANFITDNHFNGLKVKASYAASNYGDDKTLDAGIAGGRSVLGGRGHIEGSAEFFDNKGVLYRSDRAWGRNVWTAQGLGTAAVPYVLVQNTRNANQSFSGLITNGANAGRVFTSSGGLAPFVHGVVYSGGFESGGDGAYGDSSIKAPLRSKQLFARFDYDLTSEIKAYLAATTTWNFTEQFNANTVLANVTIDGQDAFLPAAARQTGTFRLSKTLLTTPRSDPQLDQRQSLYMAGLDGKFGAGYHWNASYARSDNRGSLTTPTNLSFGRLYAALDAVTSNGQTVCNVTVTNPGLYPGCVPLNVFGPNSESQAAVDYILNTTMVDYRYTMDDASGSISGTPFSSWSGPATTALSGEWRKLTYTQTSNALPTDLLSCTGLRYNCTATSQAWSGPTANRTPVSQTVSEVAVETDVPILKDVAFAKDASINAAARYTHYDSSGSVTTWKVGLTWHVNDQLTARATHSRDIRAASLNELYLPPTITLTSSTDVLTNTTPANVQLYNAGNPDLKPEVSTTRTLGIVYKPSWSPNFSLAVDAYDIKVRDAISRLNGTAQDVQSACYASGGASTLCQLIVRPNYTSTSAASNTVTQWRNSYVNIAQQHTYGLDIEANYKSTLLNRPLTLRGLFDWQPHIQYDQAGLPSYDMGGVAFGNTVNTFGGLQASPQVRATAILHYAPADNFAVDMMSRWRSKMTMGASTVVLATPMVPSVTYTNLTLTYSPRLVGKTEIYLATTNVFNEPPPTAAFYGNNASVGLFSGFAIGDDPIGRSFTLGVRLRY